MEQEERRQRAALNKEFRQFADKISDAVGCFSMPTTIPAKDSC